MEYQEFIFNKARKITNCGFEIDNADFNNNLFAFQKHIVKKALIAGKYAIFADCGLGKTIMQLEWANQIVKKESKPVLIISPLAVVEQTIREGLKFGIDITRHIGPEKTIQIINYEQLKNINTRRYIGVVLDESSILKNFEGKYKKLLIDAFEDTKYKLCCTATPAPNDPMEIGNHSEFLSKMKRLEMLSMYFVHDGGNTSKWRLKGHAINKFYKWMSSWAIMLSKPSDIGYPDDGYDLAPIKYIEYQIKTPVRNNGMLFNEIAVSATNFNDELRKTKKERITKALEIVNSTDDQYIIWCKHNAEADILAKAIPDSFNVKGSDSPEFKKDKLLGFADNEFRVLITKTKIAQFGLNYQNCHNQIFVSLDFSFEGLYQAIRRSYRFGQINEVNIHLITTDTMQNVAQSIKNKQESFEKMQQLMIKNQTLCI